MEVTETQKKAAQKVVEASRILQLAAREAERANLDVNIMQYNNREDGSRIVATVKLKEEKLVATTEKK